MDIQCIHNCLTFHGLARGGLQGQARYSTSRQSLVQLREESRVALFQSLNFTREPNVNQNSIGEGDNYIMDILNDNSKVNGY